MSKICHPSKVPKNMCFMLRPYFVQNKYVDHKKNSSPPRGQTMAPRGPTIWEPLIYTEPYVGCFLFVPRMNTASEFPVLKLLEKCLLADGEATFFPNSRGWKWIVSHIVHVCSWVSDPLACWRARSSDTQSPHCNSDSGTGGRLIRTQK
jgi:hypothetical protein